MPKLDPFTVNVAVDWLLIVLNNPPVLNYLMALTLMVLCQ
jgi:hypothetical protein